MKLELEGDLEAQEAAAEGRARFEPNAFYERLISMRETNPQAFDSMAPATKLTLGYYEGAKRRAALMNEESDTKG
jgi:hypothetical protein